MQNDAVMFSICYFTVVTIHYNVDSLALPGLNALA